MKTVKELKEELNKFPENAKVYAYEGERTGLAITYRNKSGFIQCCESPIREEKTELLN